MSLENYVMQTKFPSSQHHSSSTHIPDKTEILFYTQRKINFVKHFNGKHTLISYKMYKTEKHSDECCIVCLNILHSRNHIYHNTKFPHISSVTLFSTENTFSTNNTNNTHHKLLLLFKLLLI